MARHVKSVKNNLRAFVRANLRDPLESAKWISGCSRAACVNIHFLTLEFPNGELNRTSGDADAFSESARAREKNPAAMENAQREIPKSLASIFLLFFFFFPPFRSD